MLPFTLLAALLLSGTPADSARITVLADQPGIPVYLGDEYLGTAPVHNRLVEAGRHWITVADTDSLEALYSLLRTAPLGAKLNALWTMARINAATTRVELEPGRAAAITLSAREMDRAETQAKWLVYGSAGGLFILGAVIGAVVMAVAQ
uniref:PEGA domain-containing protein n=1 Tax=candidate division WOR-3 bacterium TaxID=2052148 RepID=A0A7C4GEF9_UNCW3